MADLASDDRAEARGPAEAEDDPRHLPTARGRTNAWRGWYGGVAMLAVCFVPQVLLFLRPRGSWTFHSGTHFTWDVAGALSVLPGVAACALLAPLVGYRRRDALLMALPVAQVYVGWIAGARAAQLRPGDPPPRWDGSREARGVAYWLSILWMVAYGTWVIVVEVQAMP